MIVGVRLGEQSFQLSAPPAVLGWASVVGQMEGDGPLGDSFGRIEPDHRFGQSSWEKAEAAMQQEVIAAALRKAGLHPSELDCLLAGDLLNQCIGSSFAARGLQTPFCGLYGACSTMGEGLLLAAMTLEAGCARCCGVVTSSHFCSAERQYRTPLEYGSQRTPTAQWTVTGAGAVVLGQAVQGLYLTGGTLGRVVDKGITDANNMGAAMAPAACETLLAHFRDTGRKPGDYDLICTGDLGLLGSALLLDLLQAEGVTLSNHQDCGAMIFDPACQDVHAGGSGAGCCASVLAGWLLNGMRKHRWNRVLFCPTGALLSPLSCQQGESIPAICHAVVLENNLERS